MGATQGGWLNRMVFCMHQPDCHPNKPNTDYRQQPNNSQVRITCCATFSLFHAADTPIYVGRQIYTAFLLLVQIVLKVVALQSELGYVLRWRETCHYFGLCPSDLQWILQSKPGARVLVEIGLGRHRVVTFSPEIFFMPFYPANVDHQQWWIQRTKLLRSQVTAV